MSFDPNLPDPSEPDGHFNPGNPNYKYMRQVVKQALEAPAPPPAPAGTAPAEPSGSRSAAGSAESASSPRSGNQSESVAPQSLANSC